MLCSRFLLFFLALCFGLPARAQNPVKWSASLEPARAGSSAQVVLQARIEAPWYIYAPTTPPGGPVATTIELRPSPTLKSAGKWAQPQPQTHFDEGFQMKTETFARSVSFRLPVTVKSGTLSPQATVRVRFQTCNARMCLPPKTVDVPLGAAPGAGAAASTATSRGASAAPSNGAATPGHPAPSDGFSDTSANQVPRGAPASAATQGLLAYAGVALGAGFLALLTPCVFPMIPITVSFFTKRAEGKSGGLGGPLAFCAGIIGTFTVVGIAASLLFGASGIARFATNPVVNLGLAALFLLLAFNLFGAYEIVVPSSVLNRVSPNGKAGLLAPLLMGFAFTLTSFTCTVPFVGTALFAAATGGLLYPVVGMLAFSTAFALPFFLLALFPGWLAKMPRAGSWLVSVKAFLGFLELGAALKFLSNADLVWQLGWLTRPVFLALWFALALGCALFLLQIVRLPRQETGRLGPFRIALGAAMIGVAALLLGALNGRGLGDFDAYLPLESYGQSAPRDAKWLVNDLAGAQKLARQSNKPLLINFTGYACTNCRLMEKNVLPRPEVVRELRDFVAVELYTDGTDARSREFNRFQQQRFGTVAIPLYAVITPDGRVSARLDGLERDVDKFAAFLNQGRQKSRLAAR